jgi:membrane protein YdbS with pleckstrin-like domain
MNDVPTFAPSGKALNAPDYVRKGEDVVWLGRPTMALLVSNILGLSTTFIFFGFFLIGLTDRLGPLGMGGIALGVLFLLALFITLQVLRIQRTQYVVTRQSIYTRTGIIGQTVIQTTFDKITDISLKQDVLGRILGFSSLNVNTAGAGTAPVRMDGLRDALQTKSLIEAAREQFLQRPDRDDANRRPQANVPKFIPDRLLIRLVCPTSRKTFKRPRAEVGSLAPCPHCGKQHLVKEAPRGDTRPA